MNKKKDNFSGLSKAENAPAFAVTPQGGFQVLGFKGAEHFRKLREKASKKK